MAKRKDDRVIIHFDYDCFYASVFEVENPALKNLPLAVQQKQIIVTCNYEARRRGLKKLQLIAEAKQTCPEVIIVLGEDLTKFRDASKVLYKFIESFSWNRKVERLGFDEVFLDVTDIIDYNQELLNPHDLTNSFFQVRKDDPTQGFPFNATQVSGHSYPEFSSKPPSPLSRLEMRLVLGSHLARHIRHRLEEDKGYTSTVGISTNKLVAKLVGNLHKPKDQTTLWPPYTTAENIQDGGERESNITTFLDGYDIGKIPGIGAKTALFIRNHILSRPAAFDEELIYGGIKEDVTVRDVRLFPGMGPELLENILGGKPGAEKGIGKKIWGLLNGIDNTEVKNVKNVPSQISIEDSYTKLDNFSQVLHELQILAASLIRRMHMDLVEDDHDDIDANDQDHSNILKSANENKPKRKWIAHPKTLRLSTRPRPPPLNADGTRSRSRAFNRISRSVPLPTFVFNLHNSIDDTVEKLVNETLLPMFRKLHPEKTGWNLSLINICVANMTEMTGAGRNISTMFRRQEDVLREWRVEDRDVPPDDDVDDESFQHQIYNTKEGITKIEEWTKNHENFSKQMGNSIVDIRDMETEPSAGNDVSTPLPTPIPQNFPTITTNHTSTGGQGSEDLLGYTNSQSSNTSELEEFDEMPWDSDGNGGKCEVCGVYLPAFAVAAHERFHGFTEDNGDRG